MVLYMKATNISKCIQKFFALSDSYRSFLIVNRTIVRTTVSAEKIQSLSPALRSSGEPQGRRFAQKDIYAHPEQQLSFSSKIVILSNSCHSEQSEESQDSA